MGKHSLFVLLVQRFKFKRESSKKRLQLKQNILQAAHPTLKVKYYADACVTLNASTAPVTFAPPPWVSHVVFIISLVLEQTSEDCIGNTEHSDINVNDECNSNIIFALLPTQTECNRIFCHLIP